MTIDWYGYEFSNPGVIGPLNILPRSEARRAFDRWMDEKRERLEMLDHLLRANSGDALTNTDDGIQLLNEWFLVNVEPDPNQSGRLLPEWYSVVNDVARFLGEVIIERCPTLRWEFYTAGKKEAAYQRHVIMGFSRVPNPKFNLDIDRNVANYAHRIVASQGSVPSYGNKSVRGVEIDVDAAADRDRVREVEKDAFWRWVKTAESKA
jgi:hypothetical protein